MAEANVVPLDFWPSSYGMRVKIALAEKGISYECKQEDLEAKSSLILEMNPVHKMIPVLIHNGKSICESLNIVQYIDEAWNLKPSLLPSDLYKRSQARFYELGDKPYFGGEDFGYVDVALVPFTSCFYTVETCGKLSIEEECPKLLAWPRGAWKKSVAKSLPHPHQIYAFAMQYKQRHGLE
ncbi:putative glutathione S-transferase parA [Glycine soja]|nr:putative glutathione S-transferase parA [Glycine max]